MQYQEIAPAQMPFAASVKAAMHYDEKRRVILLTVGCGWYHEMALYWQRRLMLAREPRHAVTPQTFFRLWRCYTALS